MFLDNIIHKEEKKDNEQTFKEEISECIDVEYLKNLMEKIISGNKTIPYFIMFNRAVKFLSSSSTIYMLYRMLEFCLSNGRDIADARTQIAIFMIYLNILSLGAVSWNLDKTKEETTYRKWQLGIIQKRLYELQNTEEESQKLNLNRLK